MKFKRMLALFSLSIFAPLLVSPALAMDGSAYSSDNMDNGYSGDGTIYYYERDGSNPNYQTRIMRKSGNQTPENIYTIDGYPRDYKMSSDSQYMAVNYGKNLGYLNMRNRQMQNIYSSNGQIGGAVYSPDNSRMFFTDNYNGRNYFHNYNLAGREDQTIGYVNRQSTFYPISWRADGKIVFVEVRGKQEIVWYLDLNSRKFTKTNYTNPSWMSQDGRYMAMASDYSGMSYSHHIYDPYRRYNDSMSDPYKGKYNMVDPTTGYQYGQFGNRDQYHSIMGYDQNSNEIMYRSADRNYYDNRSGYHGTPEYYRMNMANGQVYNENQPYKQMRNDKSVGAEIYNYGNIWVILVDKNELVSSNHPMGLIGQYPGGY